MVLITSGGVGLAELCVPRGCHHGTPTPTSPRRHSTFLAPASPTCCQGNKDAKLKKKKKKENKKKSQWHSILRQSRNLWKRFWSAWEGNGNWASNYRFSTNSFLFPGYSVCSRHCLLAILCLQSYECQTPVKRESERAFLEWRRGGRENMGKGYSP